ACPHVPEYDQRRDRCYLDVSQDGPAETVRHPITIALVLVLRIFRTRNIWVLQEFPGNMGVRCKEGYDPWIVRLGPAEESDTLMKARTRRGHDGHDRTKQRLCLLSGLCPLCPALSASS